MPARSSAPRRQYRCVRRRLRRPGRARLDRPDAAGATATAKRAQAVAVGARLLEVRGSFDDALRICRELGDAARLRARQFAQPGSHRGPEDGRLRAARSARVGAGDHRTAVRRRRNVSAVAAGLPKPARRRGSSSARPPSARPRGRPRSGSPSRRTLSTSPALVASGRVEVVTLPEDEIRTAWKQLATTEGAFCEPASAAGYAALRATRRGQRRDGGLHSHRPRPQGHRRARRLAGSDGRRREPRGRPGGARMRMRVVAPASTANLGPAFDSAAAALELWNEVVVEETPGSTTVEIEGEGADELPRDASHLSLRAFALFAPVEGYRFSFVNRIPLERGLGSSAAAIALGVVAGSSVAGEARPARSCLARAVELEGHSDNLAAALFGGVCISWRADGRVRATRIADDLPLASILAVPSGRTNTTQSRNGLPASRAARGRRRKRRLRSAARGGDRRRRRRPPGDALPRPPAPGIPPRRRAAAPHPPGEPARRCARPHALGLRPVSRRLGRARARRRRRCRARELSPRRHQGAPAPSRPGRSRLL